MFPFTNKLDSPRQAAEKELAQEFLSILERHDRQVRRLSLPTSSSSSSSNNDEDDNVFGGISAAERIILSRTSYQNWTLGLTAGAITFGLLAGVTLRSASAAARYQLPSRAPSAYHEFDVTRTSRILKGNKRFPSNQQKIQQGSALEVEVGQAGEAMDSNLQKKDAITQVHLMVYGATAMVVTILTSWFYADRNESYRQLGRLPLAPGRSFLCQAACPDLIEHYRSLVLSENANQKDDSSALNRPETIELDSMLQLVLNCQQRSQYEAHTRHRDNLPEDQVVKVPKPGIPFNYLGVPVPDKDSALQQNKTNDDIVHDDSEYDWLRKLVLDRSS